MVKNSVSEMSVTYNFGTMIVEGSRVVEPAASTIPKARLFGPSTVLNLLPNLQRQTAAIACHRFIVIMGLERSLLLMCGSNAAYCALQPAE